MRFHYFRRKETQRTWSDYEGVRLRVKVIQGILCVQVATSTITNFDYHTSAPITNKGSDFQEVRIPFQEMKRAWSEATVLDLTTVTSVNLVSFGLSKDAFATKWMNRFLLIQLSDPNSTVKPP